ncbi:putative vacuolar protein sorting-associated protein 4B-like [Capsicum annuum]|nr:putative vacuolar protein sorting-associated protein 4B-like [Capsicum annuum]
MDSKGFNVSIVALFACLILSFSSSILTYRALLPPIRVDIVVGLIRLHFTIASLGYGCDASVLLDGQNSKKAGIPNKNNLLGFEVIDAAKAALEAACPGTVSCADILAFAARDSSYKVGRIDYDVQAGRRDGHVSIDSETLANLPSPFFDAKEIMNDFPRKGMLVDEMVTLSGAHSIGIAHCAVFANCLYPQNNQQNLPIDPEYSNFLKSICPLEALTNGTELIIPRTLIYGSIWARKFAAAMVHMGTLDVLKGRNGEIRRNYNFVN